MTHTIHAATKTHVIYNILINVLLHKSSVQSFTTSSGAQLNVDFRSEIFSNVLEVVFLLACWPTKELESTLFPSIMDCEFFVSLVTASECPGGLTASGLWVEFYNWTGQPAIFHLDMGSTYQIISSLDKSFNKSQIPTLTQECQILSPLTIPKLLHHCCVFVDS